ncbi:hypothetical protein [Arcobacter sp.]|uniref:hypothetical protein n=1 Tax=Arcobacter sp. TaxID=1872629 RepID=UPI003C732B2D
MIKLGFNSKLLEEHFNVLEKELANLILKLNADKKIIKKRKKSDGTFENYTFLVLTPTLITLMNSLNLTMLLKSKFLKEITVELKSYPKSSDEYKLLFYIFVEHGYMKYFTNGKNFANYSAYTFVENLNIKTCPYCNRNYIFVVKKGKLRPEIDHFYPKTVYPYLAVNYFNLIPSCQTCNKTKSDKFNPNWINPYDVEKVDYKLTYKPKSINFTEVENLKYDFDSFDIDFISVNENIKTFKLKELYKQHKDIVLELLIKKAYYPKSYIEELKAFGFSEDEVYRYLLGNYKKEEDLHKRPLSKLIKDISEELGLI